MNVTLDLGTDWTFKSKEPKMVEPKTDPIALSVAWHRLRTTQSNHLQSGISTLLQEELFDIVTTEDKFLANKIRDFYSKKLMMWKLMGGHESHFRKDLNHFIHNPHDRIDEKLLPLIYRLPEFYFYDLEFNEMKRGLNPNKVSNDFILDSNPLVLYPLKEFKINRKIKRNEYWMRDKNNFAYLFVLQSDNILKPLWDREFSNPEILIDGSKANRYVRNVRDGFHYISITKLGS